jgi:hypothetical protein
LSTQETAFDIFKRRLDHAIAVCQQPEERRIGFGNLRHEYCDWCRGDENDTNVAIIYETPGGSTTQLNVAYDHNSGEFLYLADDLESSITTRDPEQAIRYVEEHMRDIPHKRLAQVEKTVETWLSMGKGRSEIIAEFNNMLQTEFLGGRVNTVELKHGIQYLMKSLKTAPS